MGNTLEKDEISEAIDNQLRIDHEANTANNAEKCAILLGAKGVGKTTIMKQFYFTQTMNIINTVNGNDDTNINNNDVECVLFGDDLNNILQHIIKNCIDTICTISKLLKVQNEQISSLTKLSLKTDKMDEYDINSIRAILIKLWQKKNYKEMYSLKSLYAPHLMDNMDYFLDKIDEIMDMDSEYKLTELDLVMHKTNNVRTNNLCTFSGSQEGFNPLKLLDFGPTNLSFKRLELFENVDGIIFVAALSDYAVYDHQSGENLMIHSFKMFESLCKLKWFKQTKIHLVLSKFDILKENLKSGISLSELFGSEWDSNKDYKNRKLGLTIDHLTRQMEDDEIYDFNFQIPMVIGKLCKEYLIEQEDDDKLLNECTKTAAEFIKDKYVEIFNKYNHLHDHPLNLDWYPNVCTNLCLMRATLWGIRCNLHEK